MRDGAAPCNRVQVIDSHTAGEPTRVAATSDKLPLIGPTHDPTLYLLAGFEGLGITTALAAARLLVDQLLARQSVIDASPYLPQRVAHAEALHA